jgi:hypothetical protein
MELRINKPNDGGGQYRTSVSSSGFTNGAATHTIGFLRRAKDPVHAGIEQFWRHCLVNRSNHYSRFRPTNSTYNTILMIGNCPVSLEKTKSRYYINGKAENLATICSALARLTYKSCFEKDAAKLLQGLYASLAIPENVKYCIENRFPYFFYDNYEKFECRMAVMLIGDDEVAIEIADGVWGTMKIKKFNKLCNFYVLNQKRGKMKFLSPQYLYELTMDKKPTESELKVMVEFLKQNRMQDIVEKRAIELVNELLNRHSKKLKAVYDGKVLETIYIHGKDYDWKLTNNKYKSGIQMVSTFIWQPDYIDETVLDENGEETDETIKVQNGCSWHGPICIDNMADGSPLGDQFAARALALLNDRFTITIVNTIKRYITAEPNENRVDFDEV